ncbi:MAG: acylphosphatase [Candidatus Saganbacteria bacterium]|nr:acylphosphatase [Candidatus Saganbacteria bacterium]
MEKQLHFIFSGSVQGVGFRYTARRLACSFGIKGWVRNSGSSKVELAAQAKPQNIDLFIRSLKKEFTISSADSHEEPLENFIGFEIRF